MIEVEVWPRYIMENLIALNTQSLQELADSSLSITA